MRVRRIARLLRRDRDGLAIAATSTNTPIERILHERRLLAIVVRGSYTPAVTEFLTAGDAVQQVGFIVRRAGEPIAAHFHPPITRAVEGTPETLFVREGRLEVTLYSPTGAPVAVRELVAGDAIVLVGTGHGFRVYEDTVLIEVKQGPYIGVNDKERIPE